MAPIISTIEGRLSQLYIDGWYIHVSNYNDENYIKVLIYVLMAYDHELVWNNKKSHSRKICPPLMHYFPENTTFDRNHTESTSVYAERRGVPYVQGWVGMPEQLILIMEYFRNRLCNGWKIKFLNR